MPYQISKATLVLEVWDSSTPYGNGQFYRHRVSFDVPPEDVEFYESAMQRWHTFSEAMWAGGPKFNEVEEMKPG